MLKNLWEFPNAEGALTKKEAEIWCAEKGMKLLRTERRPATSMFLPMWNGSLAAMAFGFRGSPEEFLWLGSGGLGAKGGALGIPALL